ncbi:hypothetical protein ZEAMMB73_Zm00001d049893 [Zea mays]|uniref:Uncharacterized protein n=1 Tax=Zea mays TaxID=4577 RepID=A0A1D6PYJ7_MAIZE|nr:hypothetical protein ZEAMMB73_Zm00001d049893 [Zea mays]
MAITEFFLDGCPDSNRLLKILGDFKAVLASAFAKNDSKKVVAATSCVLQLNLQYRTTLSIVLGMGLTVVLGLAMRFGAGIFTSDVPMIQVIHRGIPFVAGTQTINSLAFVFDGINFGASDYIYSAYSMFSHRFQTLAQIRLQKQSKQLAEWNTAGFSSELTATKHKEDNVECPVTRLVGTPRWKFFTSKIMKSICDLDKTPGPGRQVKYDNLEVHF